MKYGTIPGISKPVSRLVQGTVMMSADDRESSFGLLDAVFELGCTTFDTAHGYGRGAVERVFGTWLRDRGVRERVVIIGKGAHPQDGRERVTPEDIDSDVADSLERMGVDSIDLYLLHRDNPKLPVDPIVEALDRHVRAGRVSAVGGSNWSPARLAEAIEYAKQHGLTPFVASSPNLSLAIAHTPPWEGCVSISADRAARDWYQQTRLPLFVWSSLAGGFFSGRFRRDNLARFENYFDKLCAASYGAEDNFERFDRAAELGRELHLSPAQVALAWVLNQPLDVFPLVGCRTGAEFRENAAAVDIVLAPEQLAWLETGTALTPTAR